MDFTISCDCGSQIRVSEGAAGGNATCQCGRNVQVPSLARLRSNAGMSEVDLGPEFEIRQQLATGVLPLPECLMCSAKEAEITCFQADCEQLYTQNSGGISWVLTFLSLLVMPASWVFMMENKVSEIHGRETVVPIPAAVCAQCCQRGFRSASVSLLNWIGLLAIISGLCLLFVDWSIAVASFACGLGLRIYAGALQTRHQRFLKNSLGNVPAYRRLFEKYPDAVVSVHAGD